MSKLGAGLAGLMVLSAGTAYAGGIERSVMSPRILFEDGRYVEVSASLAFPEQQGTAGPGAPTGNLFESFANFGLGYKADINDKLSYGLTFDTPWGVDTEYPGGLPYAGVNATLDSYALTGYVAYDVTERVKVYGGLRLQSMEANADIPFIGGYTVETDRAYDLGYTLGAAYSIPDIALRVALTYNSEVEHNLGTTEFGALPGNVQVSTPQSLNLEFQTGIAKDTLLFGSIRWVDWSEFAIDPPNYPPASPLVDYAEDWTTYTLGLGRRFNENWSGAVQLTYEPSTDVIPLTTLGPVDGRYGIGLIGTYTKDNMKITGGVTYLELGDTSNVLGTSFTGGSAIAAGVRIGWSL